MPNLNCQKGDWKDKIFLNENRIIKKKLIWLGKNVYDWTQTCIKRWET
jgi:hypothetical protein